MASDSESSPSTPNIKQEQDDLQPGSLGRKKSKKDKPKKRNLVRWDDDLDKQVLLTLQWACNEVGIKIPWDLVAQTIGRGVSEGAIVQHLSKLRGKMVIAKMEVPPPLKRGSVAKEPSKLYATNNGKKLPPPVFAAPSTPAQTKAKMQATPKIPSTSKPKASTKSKPKRRRSSLDDSDDDDVFNDNLADSDEEYGTAKKKARTSKPKTKETKGGNSKSSSQKPKMELGVAVTDEINQDIMATLEDGGPASRTRHVKQDFTNLELNWADEEEDEDEEYDEGGFGNLDMPATYSPSTLKREASLSPLTVAPTSKIDVANWNQGVVPNMLPVGGGPGIKAYDVVPPYQQVTMSGRTGLMTPQPSRQTSMTSYSTSLLNTPLPMGFGQSAGNGLGQGDFSRASEGSHGLFSTVSYNGSGNHLSTINNHSGLALGNGGGDVNESFPSAGFGDDYDFPLEMDDTIFNQNRGF